MAVLLKLVDFFHLIYFFIKLDMLSWPCHTVDKSFGRCHLIPSTTYVAPVLQTKSSSSHPSFVTHGFGQNTTCEASTVMGCCSAIMHMRLYSSHQIIPLCLFSELISLKLVDTVFWTHMFGRVSGVNEVWSAGRKVVTSLQKSCRWGLVAMRKRQDMAKSRSGDGFVPMTGADGCRWPWEVVCRWSWRKAQELLIDSRWCTDRLWKMI